MDNNQAEFENWLHAVWEWFQSSVRADPVRFKVTRRDPSFSDFVVVPSRDPETYPNELRCRLSTMRINDSQVCNAILECGNDRVDPSQVWAGGYMTPVFRLNYTKDTATDNYGLALTVLKASYEPADSTENIQNEHWIIDSNTSGSDVMVTM
jgi:hypothetical protein